MSSNDTKTGRLNKYHDRPKKKSVLMNRLDTAEKHVMEIESAETKLNADKEIDKLQESIIDLQCRSMKNNLIFTNLHEDRYENVEAKLRKFIFEMLQIDHPIQFGNIHRFGKRINGRPRPIVASFIYHKDLCMVLNRLKNTQYGIHEQFPRVIEQRRKQLLLSTKGS